MAEESPEKTRPEVDESELAEYLRAHPGFFDRHQETLLALQLPHGENGKVVSLLERQMTALRAEHDELKSRLASLVEHAAQNEQLEGRLHDVAVGLLERSSRADILQHIPLVLARVFDVPYATLRLGQARSASAAGGPKAPPDPTYLQLVARVEHGGSICDGRVDEAQLRFLFNDEAAEVRSCALVPLVGPDKEVVGLLALAASDPKRFAPDMGTMYLDRLGRMIGAAVAVAESAAGS
jgi:uncharacterized protein YigA (DUF484 family)